MLAVNLRRISVKRFGIALSCGNRLEDAVDEPFRRFGIPQDESDVVDRPSDILLESRQKPKRVHVLPFSHRVLHPRDAGADVLHHVSVPEANDLLSVDRQHQVAMDVVRLAASVPVKVPGLPVDLDVDLLLDQRKVEVASEDGILRDRRQAGFPERLLQDDLPGADLDGLRLALAPKCVEMNCSAASASMLPIASPARSQARMK